MIYIATGLVVVWLCGALLLIGRVLNFMRLVFNNLALGKNSWTHDNFLRVAILSNIFRFDGIFVDPANLNELGRQYQKSAIRNGRIFLVWTLAGFVLVVCTSWYFNPP